MLPSSGRRRFWRYCFLFVFVYIVSYMTRINYSAIISEMAAETGNAASALSMALTGNAVAYGIGQIICGALGDRVSPKRMIAVGFAVAVSMNLLIPFCPNAHMMLAVWCVNGFAQAFMWPPLVRYMTALFSGSEYVRASAWVSYGSSIGTILIYLLAPLLISGLGWRSVFFFSAACGAAMLAVWLFLAPTVEEAEVPAAQPREGLPRRTGFHSPTMLGIMLAIVLQGMIRDGVTTWMPSYVSETFGVSRAVSILSGVVLPIVAIVCFRLSALLHERLLRNPVLCAAAFFGLASLTALGLALLHGKLAVASVVLSALLTGCIHGVNLMLICMIPPAFRSRGSVSTVSGILNSCTYVGSAVSTYSVALIAEASGWRAALFVYLAIALLGTVLCLLCVRPWEKTRVKLMEIE